MNALKSVLTLLATLLSAATFAAVDVNKANQAELETIKGIGTASSARIIDERSKSPFKDWTDLVDRVRGVGPGNAAKFSAEGLTVNGSAYSAAGPITPASRPANKSVKPADAKPNAASNGAK